MVNLKLQVPFYQKNFPNKIIYRHSMHLTHLQDGNTKVKFLLEKFMYDPKPTEKKGPDPDPKKIGSTTLLETYIYILCIYIQRTK